MKQNDHGRTLWEKILIAPFLLLIFIYQRILSPLIPPACRHYPTCSEYSADALRMHGPLHGGWLALNRILRCNPWGTHGIDPVPWFFIHKINIRKYGAKTKAQKCDRLKH